MTIFGEMLKSYIDKNKVNIYKLAQKSGIERTTIHKIISSGRIPDEKYVQKLLDAMQLSPYEKDGLLTAYNISKDGEFVYNRRLHVKNLLDRMGEAFDPAESDSAPLQDDFPGESSATAAYGVLAVTNMIDKILSRENYEKDPKVWFFMPHDCNFFFDNLFFKYRKNKNLKIKCLFEFSKNADIGVNLRDTNLDVIGTLLPFIICSHGNFDAYYFYSSSPLRDRTILPMPYYLLTSRCILTMTADLQTSVLHSDPVMINCYKKIFAEAKEKSNPLVSNITSVIDTINYYNSKTGVISRGMSGYGSHPCVAVYFDRNIIDAHLVKELKNRDTLVNISEAVYKHMRETVKSGLTTSYFTVEGLNNFTENGIIETFSDRVFLPFSPGERSRMFKCMIDSTESGEIIYRLINTSKLKPPKCFYIDVFDGSHMNIVAGDRVGGEVNTVNISEEGVVSAFRDFLINSAVTDVVYSKEETLEILREYMGKL